VHVFGFKKNNFVSFVKPVYDTRSLLIRSLLPQFRDGPSRPNLDGLEGLFLNCLQSKEFSDSLRSTYDLPPRVQARARREADRLEAVTSWVHYRTCFRQNLLGNQVGVSYFWRVSLVFEKTPEADTWRLVLNTDLGTRGQGATKIRKIGVAGFDLPISPTSESDFGKVPPAHLVPEPWPEFVNSTVQDRSDYGMLSSAHECSFLPKLASELAQQLVFAMTGEPVYRDAPPDPLEACSIRSLQDLVTVESEVNVFRGEPE
jgi:hypothetical protein